MSANLASPAPPLSLNAPACAEGCCRIDQPDSLLRPTYFLRTGGNFKTLRDRLQGKQCCGSDSFVGKPGKAQRTGFRMFRIHCIVMDTWSGRSAVLNRRRIGGPGRCLRQDPEQSRKGSGYYSAAPASPARCHTLTAGPSHTQYHSALLFHPPLLLLFPGWREDFRRFARSIP